MGQRIQDLSPLIFSMVPTRIVKKRTVREALAGMGWTRDIHSMVTLEVIHEFIRLGDFLTDITLQPGVPDRLLSSSGQYSAKSA
ncbi:hypothetical protein PR202_gb23943 [Eleusine coracana subsp. coracana]|uniref:Uncharacterized protein n=1 Tax=Eleusine coracana subsp. coracana TaxID=191504 RepID=A0AAV5FHH0_ELECO|nr:hypothetical protein PR202_gb23931 [Eleusine coracana subsp. coracana]GJN35196.1 hypothetical protein PR202_gb23943 [Eleusine coracana subsp. coracana]